MLFWMIFMVIGAMVSILLTAFILIDAYFDWKEEKEKRERKALQEYYRKLMEG